ncbi:MAG: FAD-dependent oxidoreductase [Thermoplasmata archaeon]|nr:FAD-dependent oxidoreductase [Thermoplasmata archaeon]
MVAEAVESTFESRLLERRKVAERTNAFLFEKPSGFTFRAGQFLEFALLNPTETDAEGTTRSFSIASAPHEEALMIATRMRDTAFKRQLGELPIGAKISVKGPFGDLVLHEDASKPAVFLAGGIGITPFRSILTDAARRQLPHRMVLFYSNRRSEDATFFEEIEGLERLNPNFKMVPTMTQMENSRFSWGGERREIDRAMLSRRIDDDPHPVYYVAGPPRFVTGVHGMLRETGIEETDIRAEAFDGY